MRRGEGTGGERERKREREREEGRREEGRKGDSVCDRANNIITFAACTCK